MQKEISDLRSRSEAPGQKHAVQIGHDKEKPKETHNERRRTQRISRTLAAAYFIVFREIVRLVLLFYCTSDDIIISQIISDKTNSAIIGDFSFLVTRILFTWRRHFENEDEQSQFDRRVNGRDRVKVNLKSCSSLGRDAYAMLLNWQKQLSILGLYFLKLGAWVET